MRFSGWAALWAAAAVVAIVGMSTRGDAADRKIARAPAFSGRQLAAPPRTGWITNGGNSFNQRYSPLALINKDNVAQLQADWHVGLGGSGTGAKYSGQGQPIVYDGVIYMSTGADDVFAIDVETGHILWSYKANLDESNNEVCCGWSSRGVALGDGRVYIGQLDGKLIALDQRTGKVVWSIQAERWQDGYTITSAPLYYDGMVITGFGGADKGTRGRVKAFDAKTGKLKWTFYNIPGPGEFGHDTWPADNDAWKYGGASVWQTPAVDPELGMIYYSTGNAAPDLNGSHRAGDNLFASSIVALDARTGKYRWHFQQVHHDIWDYDSPNPVILFDVMIDGKLRRGLGEVSKTGWLYLLDRETGKPLIGIEERPVPQESHQHTAATQPYPVGDPVVPHSIDIAPEGYHLTNGGRIFTPFWTETVLGKPGSTGGANWPPSSYDPDTNLFYVCAHDTVGGWRGGFKDNDGPTMGTSYNGGEFVHVGARVRGIFAAMDVRTNKIAWRQQWNDMCYSGSMVTAGGLLFIGRNDGRLTALDKSNGDLLWQFQTDAAINATASTFEYKGKQYVVALAAGSYFPGTKRGDSVWLFSLDGKIGPLPPFPQNTAGSLSSPPPQPNPERAADLSHGKNVYTSVCQPCHGANGEGGHGGGAPLTSKLTLADIMAIASAGKNDMPSFRQTLTTDDLQDVGSYIVKDLVAAK
jgi:quinohemoprotein ethanol dehydrogenase